MAGEEVTLGTTPEALAKRRADVVLSDGSTITVHKWSWLKFQALIPLVGLLGSSLKLATESVEEKDRERVSKMDGDDILAISIAATNLNLTPGVLGNLETLLRHQARVEEAAERKRGQSSQS